VFQLTQKSGGAVEGPIAVFDSGVGGLTVVKELLKQLPNESIVYYGDTARAPYGPRPKQEVVEFSKEIVHYLQRYHPKMIVIACNTATAVALEEIKAQLDIPVIGVIEPGARAALQATQTGYIAVIGTEGTIKSKAYDKALLEHSDHVQMISQACPTFVPLVEKGEYYSNQAYEKVHDALSHMATYPIDCLILGCTHYPFLADAIAAVMGSGVKLIHSAEETAREVKHIVAQLQLEHELSAGGAYSHATGSEQRFVCSGEMATFRSIVEQWLGLELAGKNVVYEQSPKVIT